MKGKTVFFIVLIIAIAISLLIAPIYHVVMNIIYPVKYESVIKQHALENELDPYLVFALIKAESNFVADAASNKGAKGLMQITDATAIWSASKMKLNDFDISSILDPSTNVSIGCWYLKYLIDQYNGDVTLALYAYNAGSGNVNKWLSNDKYSSDGKTLETIPFTETKKYVENIEKYLLRYKKLYPNF